MMITLGLDEIRTRRREALQEGKHHVVRMWEQLEREAAATDPPACDDCAALRRGLEEALLLLRTGDTGLGDFVSRRLAARVLSDTLDGAKGT